MLFCAILSWLIFSWQIIGFWLLVAIFRCSGFKLKNFLKVGIEFIPGIVDIIVKFDPLIFFHEFFNKSIFFIARIYLIITSVNLFKYLDNDIFAVGGLLSVVSEQIPNQSEIGPKNCSAKHTNNSKAYESKVLSI